ncbi:hypothetical protein [Mycobacterium marinum]|uniref:ORC-CDC6 family AAA ATPase n=1 Tax=Mycobacterium marinum TaxID=1781 RepID=UPI000E3C6923|nr:hypothetical protein [Mycobacterium marinum]
MEVLESIEPHHFDVPVILRSVPGSGKTSLMQILAAPWLVEVVRRPNDYDSLAAQLEAIGVLGEGGEPRISGALINLERDFSPIMDVGATKSNAMILFKRLVDARVLAAHLYSARLLHEGESGEELVLTVPSDRTDLAGILRELGSDSAAYISASRIEEWASGVESLVRKLLYDLDPFDWDSIHEYSTDFISFPLLEDATINFGETPTSLRPVTFLDDLHRLRPEQRDAILEVVHRRAVTRGLWVAERTEVLPAEHLVGDDPASMRSVPRKLGEAGRDLIVIDLTTTNNSQRSSAYTKMLKTVARKRAAMDLQTYADTTTDFLQLLDEIDSTDWAWVEARVTERLHQVDDARFDIWIDHLTNAASNTDKSEAERVKDLRGGLSLIEAEQRKAQEELFSIALPAEDLDKKITASVREAALVTLGREYPSHVPIYYGSRAFISLANQNVSQLLRVGADLFDVVLGTAARGHDSPAPTSRQQHRTIKSTCDKLWRDIPGRVDGGHQVQALLTGVGRFAMRTNEIRPTSYAPGITGFAMTMTDLRMLVDPETRETIPGGDDLLTALYAAVANNYLTKYEDISRGPGAARRAVFYINRLLCPQWNLPLGHGGYRTRRVHEIAKWMSKPPVTKDVNREDIDISPPQEGLFDG